VTAPLHNPQIEPPPETIREPQGYLLKKTPPVPQ
jgi:hypothetical protein